MKSISHSLIQTSFSAIFLLLFFQNLHAQQEICGNEIDDDLDGRIDCLDGDCLYDTNCLPCQELGAFELPSLYTGLDEVSGDLFASGSRDSTWQFSFSQNGIRTPAYVGTCACDPNDGWDCSDLPSADWISDRFNCSPANDNWYHTTFELDSVMAPYFRFLVTIYADDLIQNVYLNGERLDIDFPQRGSYATGQSINFAIETGFIGGTNELSIHILNTGGPGGMKLAAVPAPDLDQDGVLNQNDRCPLSPQGLAVDANGCSYFETTIDTTICEGDILTWDGQDIQTEGEYQRMFTASIGCDSLVTLNVAVQPFNPNINFIPPRCVDDPTGQITIQFSDPAPKTYQLFNNNDELLESNTFSNIYQITNLLAGEYELQVSNENGCSISEIIVIAEPEPINIEVEDLIPVACFGENTGSFDLNISGGVAPYLVSFNGQAFSSQTQYADLSIGNYEVVVQDANDCIQSMFVEILQPDAPLSMETINQTDVDCFGNLTGSLEVEALGGTTPYQYYLDLQGQTNSDGLFTELGASDYTIRVEDAVGCEYTIRDTIRSPDGLFVSIQNLEDVKCFGDSTGLVEVVGVGGVPPYNITIDDINFSQDLMIDDLLAGLTKLTLTDANGCKVAVEFLVGEPEPLTANLRDRRNIDCFGNNSGSISVFGNGGIGSYQIFLNDIFNQGSTPNESISIEQLAAGEYKIEVFDENNCSSLIDVELTQPPLLALSLEELIPVDCYGNATGRITSIAAGGRSPFTYQINGLDANTGIFEGLLAGEYLISVEDDSSCFATLDVEVSQPDSLQLLITQQEDAYCSLENGELRVLGLGGTMPYEYIWPTGVSNAGTNSSSLSPGGYEVMIRDQNGCIANVQATIGDIPPPIADFSFMPSPPDLILPGVEVQFLNQSMGNIQSYLWDFGTLDESQEENPTYTYPGPRIYAVSLTAFDSLGLCPNTITKEILVSPTGEIWLPNVFSPNGDGIQDEFIPVLIGVQSFQLSILNRWGKEVFVQRQPQTNWDGKMKSGNLAPEGVYFYVIQAKLNSGEDVVQKGSLMLVR